MTSLIQGALKSPIACSRGSRRMCVIWDAHRNCFQVDQPFFILPATDYVGL